MTADTLTRIPNHIDATLPGLPELSDMPTPEVFGMNPEALKRLSIVALESTIFPDTVNEKLRWIPQVVMLAPLIESMLPPQEVVPRTEAPDTSFSSFMADKLKTLTGKAIATIVERNLEHNLHNSDTKATEKAEETLGTLEKATKIITTISSFDNPQQQFTNEASRLSRDVSAAITEQRNLRTAGKSEPVPKQKGFIGLALHVVRKVKGLFKRFFNRPDRQSEITAYDAGASIEKVYETLTSDPEATAKRFPMLSTLVLDNVTLNKHINREYFSLAAPEIMTFLSSASNTENIGKDLLSSIERNPHDFRFITKHKNKFGKYSVDAVQRASHTLLPAMRDALPDQGDKLNGLLLFLQSLSMEKAAPKPHDSVKDDVESDVSGLKSAKKLLQKFSIKRKS
ncbi:MAG: hypothetical protein JWM81_908 [Candidatus Saccharibacteria bacterium]|nr:hypothetical protein [Candidatus Saccharibacteria bacterium]